MTKTVPRHSLCQPNDSNLLFFPSEGLIAKNVIFSVFSKKLNHFPTLGAIKFIVNLDCLQVHIHNIITKTAPRHSFCQPNKSNLLFFPSKVLLRKSKFLGVFQIKIKPLSHTGGNKIYSQSWLPSSPHS